jgi:transcription elongation factor Elf1
MSKAKAMLERAEAAGYAGRLSATKLSYKQYGCPTCRKNTAIKLVSADESHAVVACICGYRKKTTNLH